LPKKIIIADTIPVMATGKINYPAVVELASNKKSQSAINNLES